MKIWHILFTCGLVLLIGTIGAADFEAIGSVRIVIQFALSIVLMVMSYVSFVAACNRWYRKRGKGYGRTHK